MTCMYLSLGCWHWRLDKGGWFVILQAFSILPVDCVEYTNND